jgi:DNA-binding transcriptional ArsR family regulator
VQSLAAELQLNLPWAPQTPERVGELAVRRGRADVLSYDDGIQLEVRVLHPGQYSSVQELLGDARRQEGAGRVLLVAGAVPVGWRPQLREAELSFIDVAGVMDIAWPRLRVSVRRFGQPVERRRSPLPLQKGYAVVVQELLIATAASSSPPTIGKLADGTGVSLSTASRVVSQLAEHGLVTKERAGKHVTVILADRVAVADRLATQSAWPGGQVLGGHLWGRNGWDIAARLSRNADAAGIGLAVTGRAAAAFLGVLGTSSPSEVRCWAKVDEDDLAAVAGRLGLEPVSEEAANVALCADRQRVGMHRRQPAGFDEWTATIANPVRVWCDLHGESRGNEFASQLWGAISNARCSDPR